MSSEELFEQRHRRNIAKYQQQVWLILEKADKDIAAQLAIYKAKIPNSYSEGVFFRINRSLEKKIDTILDMLQAEIGRVVQEGIEAGWQLANRNMDDLVKDYTAGFALSKPNFFQINTAALQVFLNRAKAGMNLSERIWKLTKVKKYALERYLASGIYSGKSAAAISRDIRRFELNPNMLFRRVRDAEGQLHLSRSAMAYHPGQGVYRSSYKNAMRLTRTETNIAYRTAEFYRRKELPFVTGIRVELSAAHPMSDICDAMAGEYPKGFLFTGWHPQCMCFATSILLPKDEFVKYLDSGEVPAERYVSTIPERAKIYLKENEERFLKMKNAPEFMKEKAGLGKYL